MEDYLDEPKLIGGVMFRAFTAGTRKACFQMKLSIFTGVKDDDTVLNEEELENQVIAFAWLQSAPFQDVKKALATNTWKNAVLDFSFSFPISLIPQLMVEVSRIQKAIEAVAVEVVPKPNEKPEENVPPN
jgi:hypothetical protein